MISGQCFIKKYLHRKGIAEIDRHAVGIEKTNGKDIFSVCYNLIPCYLTLMLLVANLINTK